MSASTVLTALVTVLPAGTAVQQTVVETTLDLIGGSFPGIALFAPSTKEKRVATGRKAETHTITVVYLDKFESSVRTMAQITADARTALEAMKANLRANQALKVGGTPYALDANMDIDTTIHGIVDEVLGKALPFPMLAAELQFDVWDLWLNA